MTSFITWMLLAIFTKHTTGHKEDLLQCGPQDMNLSSANHSLLVAWEDHPSCVSVKDLTYELLVLVDHQQVHYEEIAVTEDLIGSSHFWSWMPSLPLGCASHSVRITSRYHNHTGLWIQDTLPGLEPSGKIEVFPQDRVFAVGSRATFCCIIPVGETFDKMSMGNYRAAPMNTSQINNHTYTLTVDLLWPTPHSDADIKCRTLTSESGACAQVGFPPSDSDLKCETRDFQSVECHWRVGHQISTLTTYYELLKQPCSSQSKGKCSQKVQVDSGEKNWTLTAHSELGTIQLTDTADLMKRVYMYPPEQVKASEVYARNTSLQWTWSVEQYSFLNLTCQIQLSDRTTQTQIEYSGVGLNLVVLEDLIPNWTYTAMVRCATVPHFWNWSDWSKPIMFHTEGDIPDALDVWMHKRDQQTVITWKMLEDHQSHGPIIDYEVTWINSAERQENNISVAHPNHSIGLNLNASNEYIVKVTARNRHGISLPTHIAISNQDAPKVTVSRIRGVGGGFNLSWSASESATCGYIVEWCPASGDCSVEWLRVPASNTSASIYSENFEDGVRYLLSIYSCTGGAPVMIERREGYVTEKKIPDGLFKNLRWQQSSSDVEISWDPIPLTEQSAFIQGYVLSSSHETTVIRFITDDPETTRLTARNLNITSYKFTFKAQTAVGECGSTTIDVTLNLQTDNVVSAIVISLVTAFTLLLLITVVCYRHWACIKRKVYPPIPEPVLTGKWVTSQGEHSVVPYSHSEELVVPQLDYKLPASRDGYICSRDKPILLSQTPLDFNKCHQGTAQLGLKYSQSNVLSNLMYDLLMREDLNSLSEEEDSSGYQPQIFKESFDFSQTNGDTDSIMTCISTYIVLPQ